MNQQPENEHFFTDGELEVRSTEGGKSVVYGYAALFGVRSRELRTKKGVKFVEVIQPGAFDNTDFSDVECCYDHRDFLAAEPNLRWEVDARGLRYEYDHDPADPVHVSTFRRIQRRDAKGSSFQFPPLPAGCYTDSREGDLVVRSVNRFPRVVEFGPVRLPAYRETTSHARSMGIDDLEIDGMVAESGGTVAENRGTTAELDGNQTEVERNAAELLEKRKIQIRATLM